MRFGTLLRSLLTTTLLFSLGAQPGLAQDIQWRTPQAASERPTSRTDLRERIANFARTSTRRHVVAQLSRPVDAHTRNRLAAAGLELGHHLGSNAFFASVERSTLDPQRLASIDELVVFDTIRRNQRLHPVLAAGQVPPWSKVSTASDGHQIVAAYVVLFEDVELDAQARALINMYDGQIVDTIESIHTLVVEITHAGLLALADAVDRAAAAAPGREQRLCSRRNSSGPSKRSALQPRR